MIPHAQKTDERVFAIFGALRNVKSFKGIRRANRLFCGVSGGGSDVAGRARGPEQSGWCGRDVPSTLAVAGVNSAKTPCSQAWEPEAAHLLSRVSREHQAVGKTSERDDKEKGESIVLRRCLTLAVSCCFVLALAIVPVDLLFAQDEVKKVDAPPPAKAAVATQETPKTAAPQAGDAAKKPETAKDDAAKKDAGKTEPAKPAEPPLPPIPPEVQAKIDAARKAVAEAIVAAQDAGLIESSIDPPPILDLLIDGRVTDARTLKAPKSPGMPYGVSPEVFGAWFTGYGKMSEINYNDDVRIRRPSDGLKQWYDQRARILEQYIQEIRKTKPAPTPKPAETKPAETKPAETKPAETKPAEPPAAPATKAAAPPAAVPKKS
jgi:hypothetical protein